DRGRSSVRSPGNHLAQEVANLERGVSSGTQWHDRYANLALPRKDVPHAFVRSVVNGLADLLVAKRKFHLKFAIAHDQLACWRQLHGQRIVSKQRDNVIVFRERTKKVTRSAVGAVEIACHQDQVIAASKLRDLAQDFIQATLSGMRLITRVERLV